MTKNIKISGLEVKKDYDNSQKNMKLIYFIIILICYIPAYITFFPLLFNYDAPMQTYASAEKNSPLLHTFFLKTFYILGIKVFKSATIGMTLYIIFQAIVMVLIFSDTIDFIKRKTNNKVLEIISLIFFAIFPFNQIFTFSATKDTLFAGFTIMSMMYLIDIIDGTKIDSKSSTLCALYISLMLDFRLNAIYALIVLIPFICIILFRNKKKMIEILSIVLVGIGIYFVTNAIYTNILNAKSSDTDAAKQTQLIQMCASIAIENENKLTKEEKSKIYQYYSCDIDELREIYKPNITDPIVTKFESKNAEDFNDFALSLAKKYPATAIKSILNTTRGYWFINDNSFNKINQDLSDNANQKYGCLEIYKTVVLSEKNEKLNEKLDNRYNKELYDVRYIQTSANLKENQVVNYYDFLPTLKKFYKSMFCENNYEKIPIISVIFQPSFYFYVTIAYLLFGIYRRQKEIIITGLYLFMYFGTCLLGPCAIVRYIYCIIVMTPIMISYFFTKNKENKTEKN